MGFDEFWDSIPAQSAVMIVPPKESGFDAFWESIPAPAPPKPTAEQLIGPGTKFEQGVRFGVGGLSRAIPFGDEIIGTGNALIDALGEGTFSEALPQRMDQIRRYQQAFKQEAPGSALTVDIGGGMLMPIMNLAKGSTTVGQKLYKTALEGGLYGGLYGASDAKGGILERADDALVGAGVGAGLMGALRGAGEAVLPFYQSGREAIAGRLLSRAAGKQGVENLEKAAIEGIGDMPRSFAEVAQTPSAANLELAMRREIGDEGGNLLLQALTDRQSARVDALKGLAPDAMSGVAGVERGDIMRKGAQEIKAAKKSVVDDTWEEVGKTGQLIGVASEAEKIAQQAGKFTPLTGYSQDARKVLDSFFNGYGDIKPTMSIENWQKIRSGAGEVMTQARVAGKKQEAAVMGIVRKGLDDAAERVMTGNSMQGEKLSLMKRAIGETRQFKDIYEKGAAGKILQPSKEGYRLGESSIPRMVISTPETAANYARAYGKNTEMMLQGKGALVDEMTAKSADTWVDYFNKKRPQFKSMFGDDFLKVKKVIDDLASEKSVGKLAQQATGRQSATAQNLTATSAIVDATMYLKALKKAGAVAGVAVGAATGGTTLNALIGYGAGHLVSQLANYSEKQIKNILVKSMLDPEMARLMIQKVDTPGLYEKITQRLIPTITGSAPDLLPEEYRPGSASEPYRPVVIQPQNLGEQLRPGASQSPGALRQPFGAPPSIQGQPASPTANTANQPQGQLENTSSSYSNTRPLPAAPQAKAQTISYRGDIKQLVAQQPPIIQAMIEQESSKIPTAVSPKGARGLMQVMPDTGAEVAKKIGLENYDPFNPEHSIRVGTAYFQELLQRYDGNLRHALAAYNWGMGNFEKYLAGKKGMPKETRDYITKITKNYSQLVGA